MRISDWSSDVCSSDLFLCRLVGEGDRGDAPGRMAARADQVCDLLHDQPGLVAVRACEHQQWAFDVGDRGGLLGVAAVNRESAGGGCASYSAGGCAIGLKTRQ